MSGHFGWAISESGIVKNMGIIAKTASTALSIQKLFRTLNFGSRGRHFDFQCGPMSDMVENVGIDKRN